MSPLWRRSLLTLLVLLFFTGSPSASLAAQLSVVGMVPEPAYGLTRDDDDAQQLVDGVETKFPQWTNRASVGWKDSNITEILLRWSGEVATCADARVTLVTGVSPDAGVSAPRWIDYYSGNAENQLSHAATYQESASGKPGRGAYRIRTRALLRGNYLALLIHAAGRFLMLDEIIVDDVKDCTTSPVVGERLDASKRRLDSIERIKEKFQTSLPNPVTTANRLAITLLPPYADAPDSQGGGSTLDISNNVEWLISGGLSHHLLRVIGPCEKGEFAVNISAADDKHFIVEAYSVEPVLSYSGKLRYDALRPLRHGRLACAPDKVALLWLQGRGAPAPGGSSVDMSIAASDGQLLKFTIAYSGSGVPDVPRCTPQVVVWGYSTQQPIWRRRDPALRLMLEAGVNLHVVPPQRLPPVVSGASQIGAFNAVSAEIKAVRRMSPDVKFLLFTNFKRWLSKSEEWPLLGEWVGQAAAALRDAGLKFEDWYLYPVDEPSIGDVAALVQLAKSLKTAVPGLRMYANPTVSHSKGMPLRSLRRLQRNFALLQPNIALALQYPDDFGATWLYYENPMSPAKDQPPYWYRTLGVRAAILGARGFGFWAYSDTGGSSAWDDFDGRRPDWATVYESDFGVVSSRRWAAFARGVIDYQLLCGAMDRGGTVPPAPDASAAELADWISKRLPPAP